MNAAAAMPLTKPQMADSLLLCPTKKQPKTIKLGGISDKPSNEKQTRLYFTGQFGDSFWCLKKYISLLNPKQEAFFQKPKPTISSDDAIWYENKLLGLNKLSTMMKEISLGLSKTYTNHCVRATAITIWSDVEIPARHIMSISGHACEQSISSYNTRPSVLNSSRGAVTCFNPLYGLTKKALSIEKLLKFFSYQ